MDSGYLVKKSMFTVGEHPVVEKWESDRFCLGYSNLTSGKAGSRSTAFALEMGIIEKKIQL